MPQSNRLTMEIKMVSLCALSDIKGSFTHPCEERKTQDRLRGLVPTKQDTGDDPTSRVGEELASDKDDRTPKERQMTATKRLKGPPPWRLCAK